MCHLWYGSFKQRQYFDRYQILKVGNFNPYIDLINDKFGCLTWNKDFFRIGLEKMEEQRKYDMIEQVQDYLSHRSKDPDLIIYDNRLNDIYQRLRQISKQNFKKYGHILAYNQNILFRKDTSKSINLDNSNNSDRDLDRS